MFTVGFQTPAIYVRGRAIVKTIMVTTVVEKQLLTLGNTCPLTDAISAVYIIIVCVILLCPSFLSSADSISTSSVIHCYFAG